MKKLLICIIAFSASLRVSAQEALDPIANGQTAAARSMGGGTFGSDIFNVDLYTGKASVDIPIYSHSADNINFNLSLGYDASGIKVDQIQSAVGIGWSLNLGGSITREVNGIEDEVIINPTEHPDYPKRYYGNYSRKPIPEGENTPDIYTASFFGRTIKFQNAYNVSTQSWDIRFYPYDAGASVWPGKDNDGDPKFLIKDQWGNAFYFEKGDVQYKTATEPGKSPFAYIAVEKWDLIRVVTRGGYEIKYTYDKITKTYPQYKNEEVKEIYANDPMGGHVMGIYVNKNQVEWWDGEVSQISKISFPDGVQIDFDYKDAQASPIYMQPLDKIRISQKLGQQLKNTLTYTFNHSYFHTPWNVFTETEMPFKTYPQLYDYYMNTPAYVNKNADSVGLQIWLGVRLKLNSITRKGTDNTTSEPYYSFTYNTDYPLPRRLSPSKDYFGYFNNQQSTTNVAVSALNNLGIPRHAYTNSGGSTIYGVDRTPSITFMKAGVLTSVKNGAGGKINLYYKDHILYNPANAYCGLVAPNSNTTFYPTDGENANDGLCADFIQVQDGFNDDNTYTLKYEYEDGQRFFRGGYFYNRLFSNTTFPHVYRNFYVTPMQLVNGSNHGYSRVEVKKFDKDANLLNSTKYYFTNLMLPDGKSNLYMRGTQKNLGVDVVDNNGRTPIYMYQYRMGVPTKIESKDNQGYVMTQTEYFYSDSLSKLGGGGKYQSYESIRGVSARIFGVVEDYYFWGIPYLRTKQKETTFTNNGQFIKETNYTYLDGGILETTRWVDDNGVTNVKRLEYNQILDYKVPKRTILSRLINTSELVVDCNGADYTPWGVKPTNTYRLFNNSMVDITNLNAALKNIEEFTLYDTKNRLLESKNSLTNRYTAFIRDSRLDDVVATVGGARFENVAYTSFEGDFKNGVDPDKGNWDFNEVAVVYETPGLNNQPMTGHYYYGLKSTNTISSVNPVASGQKMLISLWATAKPFLVTHIGLALNAQPYSFTQQLQVGSWKLYTAEITGIGQSVSIALDPGTGSINKVDELRMYPPDATMNTVTYEPLLGPGSTCDDQGQINYMEYDVMGRQSVVRDINRRVISVTKTVVAGPDTN